MRTKLWAPWGFVLAVGGLPSGGERSPLPFEAPAALLGEAAIALREAPPERVFQGSLAGTPMVLIVHDCEVLRVHQATGGTIEWTRVLAPEPYPFFTSCVRQSLAVEAGSVVATLGRQAFGAGGCCASGGRYRSADGRVWKKL